ncbi:MAG: septal ring lytic transglycosylase RlpA family protein [Verrucomicrobiales bacterium]
MAAWLAAGCVGCTGGRPEAAAPRAVEAPEPSGKWRQYETGIASWYGGRWHGRKTANGERYDQNSMTAAHKRLPFNTRVRVTNLRTGQSAIVRINNRGPYIRGRVIDVSRAAAQKIGIQRGGVGRVKLEVPR